jgi:lipopolysaccharide/colanic/teichoic acid biosynthesis glycosyltransferase
MYPIESDESSACESRVSRLEVVLFSPTPPWKRVLDIIGAIAALLVLWPLFLVIGMLIKCGSPGPIFFRQRRLGNASAPFTIWKFRTLTVETTGQHRSYVAQLSQSNGPLVKQNHESKLVPGGRFLRACCLDELPQLFNVLQGSMSLVGPRPDVLGYEDYQPRQRRRFDVSPGMTGLWQVSGKNSTTFDEMIKLDLEYVRRRSLWLDLRIIFTTPLAIIRQAVQDDTT